MALTVQDVADLVDLLEQNINLRQKLIQALFPNLDIARSFERLTVGLEGLQTDLVSFKEETRQNFAEAKTERTIMGNRIKSMHHDMGSFKGNLHEMFYQSRPHAIFGRYIQRGRDMTNLVADRLQEALEAGEVTDNEYDQVLATDLLWGGPLRATQEEVLLVLEASWLGAVEDVTRAIERAKIVARVGFKALPFVGAKEWDETALEMAREHKVALTENGRVDRESWNEAVEAWL